MAKQGRNYTREFKVEAVRRITSEGKSLAEVARELGLAATLRLTSIHVSTIRTPQNRRN